MDIAQQLRRLEDTAEEAQEQWLAELDCAPDQVRPGEVQAAVRRAVRMEELRRGLGTGPTRAAPQVQVQAHTEVEDKHRAPAGDPAARTTPPLQHVDAVLELSEMQMKRVFNLDRLDRCVVLYDGASNDAMSAFSMAHARNTVVSLNIPQMQGSIFVTDCEHTTLLIRLRFGEKVQIRLHNLVNCQIQVEPADNTASAQTVIIEDCDEVTFHSTAQDLIAIRNFNVFKAHTDKPPYKWGPPLPDQGQDPIKLREAYIAAERGIVM
ncbi:uncharacterized protein CGFF_01472 [Nakaseomyces glabratus]|nr:uncharacterized protein CGFF_01472 [Nakaseomyces glabratus]